MNLVDTTAETMTETTEAVTETAEPVMTEFASDAVGAIQEQVDKASGFLTSTAEFFRKALPYIVIAILTATVGIIVVRLVIRFVRKALSKSNMDTAGENFIVSVIKIVLYAVVVMMVLSVLHVPMSSVITIFGAVGLAVSLALQNCLSNLCGGFIILFSKPFSAGDTVELDGTVGTVDIISILYTKIITPDGKTVFIPNGKISEAKIINYTETPFRRVDMTFDISYSADYQRARSLILDIIKNNSLALASPEPVVRMGGHKESSVSIDVLVWTENENYRSLGYDMMERVKETFEKNNIEIPFNQLDVHFVGTPDN